MKNTTSMFSKKFPILSKISLFQTFKKIKLCNHGYLLLMWGPSRLWRRGLSEIGYSSSVAWNTGKYSTTYLAIISDDAMKASFRQIRLYSALFFQPFAWLMTGCPSSYFGSQELSQQVKHELIRQRERCRTADVRLEPFWGIIKGSLVF